MLPFLDGSVSTGNLALLFACLAIALAFEFVNGFHDTANAVATVIYTRSLTPGRAVAWSGLCNFFGVYLGGTAVAFSVVNLLPVDLLINIGSETGMAMVFALLVSAIVWNLGTWFLGLPASSSHTLIGAILGVGLAHSFDVGRPGHGVNWAKAGEVGLSLLVSPMIGFALAAVLLILLRRLVRDPSLYEPAPPDRPPPPWIRGTLILTCTGVSFAHGSKDGQKGIGLLMLILIGLVPAHYLLDPAADRAKIEAAATSARHLEAALDGDRPRVSEAIRRDLSSVRSTLEGRPNLRGLDQPARRRLRAEILRIGKAVMSVEHAKGTTRDDRRELERHRKRVEGLTEYAPSWVLIAVASALGLGTTVGWKRIVETVGEKIGKAHLSYAQGASAEVVAMSTIVLADLGGLPVSTTHVLSSGIAGTMTAGGTGLQGKTVRNIALAWVLTMPASMALAALLFVIFRAIA